MVVIRTISHLLYQDPVDLGAGRRFPGIECTDVCQKLRQMRQKVGNRQMFMKAIAFPLQTGEENRPVRGAAAVTARHIFSSARRCPRGNMRTTSVNVVRIATKGPGDVSGLLEPDRASEDRSKVDRRDTGQNRRQRRRQRFHGGYRFRAERRLGAPCSLPPHRVEQRNAFRDGGRRKVCLVRYHRPHVGRRC